MTADLPEENHLFDISDLEESINQIKNIDTVKIITDLMGEISQIHVIAGMDASAEQVSRDIDSLLIAKYGISLDPKRINIVQVECSELNLPKTEEGIRSVILGVTSLLNGRSMEIKVKLSINGQVFEGVTTGPVTSNSRLRLVSQATVLAFQNFLGDACNLVAEDIVQMSITGQPAVVSCVSLVTDVGEERLLGAAFITNDVKEAVVKATLAAINRRMSLILSD